MALGLITIFGFVKYARGNGATAASSPYFYAVRLSGSPAPAAGRTFHANRLLPSAARSPAAYALDRYDAGGVVLRRHCRSHVAVATADTDLFVHHHKTVIALASRRSGRTLVQARCFAVVAWKIIIATKDVLVPGAVIFLPVTARILINAAEADVGSGSL
ncbi:hypothetical protein KCP73_25300 [Salmonella enterica subsp. enterica]|nr:hypothetical protein KCP73_25300 [Salmonella enterica subsp. enterica]